MTMDKQDFQRTVGLKIRTLRKSQGMTQEKLAEMSDLHPTYISNIEGGKVCVSAFGIYSIASALKIRVGDLICMEEEEIQDEKFELELLYIINKLRNKNTELRQMYLSAIQGMLS